MRRLLLLLLSSALTLPAAAQEERGPSTLGVVLAPAATGGGIRVVRVVPELPAARAGLRAGDRLLGGPDGPFPTVEHARSVIWRARAGEKLKLRIGREERIEDLVAVPMSFSAVREAMRPAPAPDPRQPAPELAWVRADWGKGPLKGPSDLEGKVRVVLVFQAACPACHRHGFPTHAELGKRFADAKDVAFLALHAPFEGQATHNTPEKGVAAARGAGFEGPVFEDVRVDVNGWPEALRLFGVQGTPETLVFDRRGHLVFRGLTHDAEALARVIASARKAGGAKDD